MSTAVCSICSRLKREDAGLLPARERYLGSHIAKVEATAAGQKAEFFILSGVYGFLSVQDKVPHYEHLLATEEVPVLAQKIGVQMKRHKITKVCFYTKHKPAWAPYELALRTAAESFGILLCLHWLSDDD